MAKVTQPKRTLREAGRQAEETRRQSPLYTTSQVGAGGEMRTKSAFANVKKFSSKATII